MMTLFFYLYIVFMKSFFLPLVLLSSLVNCLQGIRLIKLYFSISKNEQEKRFKDIIGSPIKKWKFSAIDQKALELWEDYTDYKDKMFLKTNTSIATWKIIRANKKTKARIEAIEYILGKIPYENKDLNIIKPVDYDV